MQHSEESLAAARWEESHNAAQGIKAAKAGSRVGRSHVAYIAHGPGVYRPYSLRAPATHKVGSPGLSSLGTDSRKATVAWSSVQAAQPCLGQRVKATYLGG